MSYRRVQLLLSENPSDGVLDLAVAIKTALAAKYSVRIRYADTGEDDDLTPVDHRLGEPLLTLLVSETNPIH